MWIMALDTINHGMLALEQLFVLFVMFDETTTGIDLFDDAAEVTIATSGRIAVQLHFKGHRVLGMGAAWTMTLFTTHAGLSPSTN